MTATTDQTPTFTRRPRVLDEVAIAREVLDSMMRGARPWQIEVATQELLEYQVGKLFGRCASDSTDSTRSSLIRIAATAIAWVEDIDRRTEAPPLTPTEHDVVEAFGIHS